ncbi:rhodanese-like domain-containing protein [Clostridium aminobutyricum]|nr:rhodanese-like domain-containing protein [Clostridium aminobutyricum]
MLKGIILVSGLIVILIFTGCRRSNDPLKEINFDNTCGNDYQMETSSSKSIAATSFKTITPEEAKDIMEDNKEAIVVDVRRQDEYNAQHIPNAVLLPNETIDEESVSAAGLSPEDTILVYCRSGSRSKQAAQKLADMGYSNIYDFGGIINWPYETE